jgi:hypothetical protein
MDKIPENDDTHDPLNGATNDKDDTHGYSPAHTHLKTYTAGEDKSRLANAARELGLSMQQARQPRKQVRQLHASNRSHHSQLLHNTAAVVQHLFLDTSLEDARMRAIYSAHAARYYEDEDESDGYTGLFRTSLPEYLMTTVVEEQGGVEGEGGGPAVDAHGVEVGGDLVSACTGTFRTSYSYLLETWLGNRSFSLCCVCLLTFPVSSTILIS